MAVCPARHVTHVVCVCFVTCVVVGCLTKKITVVTILLNTINQYMDLKHHSKIIFVYIVKSK